MWAGDFLGEKSFIGSYDLVEWYELLFDLFWITWYTVTGEIYRKPCYLISLISTELCVNNLGK